MKILNLKIGQKVSILKSHDLVPTLYKGVLKGYYFSNFAQYRNALYMYIQRPRAKKVDRIILIENETFFIFDSYKFKDTHKKEVIKDTKEITHTLLNRWTYSDLKDNKDLVFAHKYSEKFEGVEDDFNTFVDLTGDYICCNNIKPKEAVKSEKYINYIKELIQGFNVNNLLVTAKELEFCILEDCLKQAINYNW
ncbi:hypothetical protein [Clostridium rectalis]|uniref:hypothetical protein n=1 Tax=Clostridium rectalis TaxID=2040295 RepID=UPI000F63ADD7|nr:hypothetical protein [Clostridium rectalis]